MFWMRMIGAGVLFAVAAFVMGCNLWIVISSFVYPRKKLPSMAPIIVTLFGVTACRVCPVVWVQGLWWVVLIADVATLPCMAYVLLLWVTGRLPEGENSSDGGRGAE